MELKPGYKRTEVGVIPEDWEVVQLGELGETLIGLTYKPTDVRPHGILVLRSSNIQNDSLAFDDNVFVDMDIPDRIKVQHGDVLICTRNGSRDLIGKSVFLGDQASSMTFGAFMAVYRSPIGALAGFLFQSDVIKQQITAHLGATINQITNKSLKSFLIPLAPQETEQRAIATALSDTDALLDALDRLIAKKRDLKQAAMQQLLTGQTRLPGFSGEWARTTVGACVAIRNAKVSGPLLSAALPCIELDGISQGTGRLLGTVQAAASGVKYSFKQGDVLFGRLRAYLRKYWHATFDGICSTEIWPLFSPNESLDQSFLFSLVQTDSFMEAAGLSYGTHMPRSDWAVLKNVELCLPSRDEQTAIATALSDMDAELDALETRRAKTAALKQAMMQELLTGRIRLPLPADTEAIV